MTMPESALLTPEQQISIRGLVTGGFQQTPLRHFKGTFAGYKSSPASGYDGIRVDLNFGPGIQVLASTEPYNLPTATLNIGYSKTDRSGWGYLSQSLAKFLQDNQDIDDAIGKEWELMFTDGQEGQSGKRLSPDTTKVWHKQVTEEQLVAYPDKMIPTPMWVVVGYAGATAKAGAGSANDQLLAELIGKTRADFNSKAFTLEVVRQSPDLQRAIQDKSFIAGMIATSKVHEDANGVFQAGAAPA